MRNSHCYNIFQNIEHYRAPPEGANSTGCVLRDAIARCVQVAQQIGVRAILVHALHEEARRFYTRYQFESSPTDPLHLMLLIKDYQSVVLDGSHRRSRAFVAQGISLRG